MNRIPISVRMAALSALSLTALLALLGVLVYQQLGTSLREGVDQQLADVAANLPRNLIENGLQTPEFDDEEIGDLEPSDRLLQLVDDSGSLMVSSDDLEATSPLLDAADLDTARDGEAVLRTVPERHDSTEELRVLAVPYAGEGQVVIVAAELDEIQDAQQALISLYGPIALLGATAAGAVGYLIARRGLAPVRRLSDEAEAIKGSDPSQRLTEPAQYDEIGRLTVTLNGMLARLDAAISRERAFTADASHELRTPLAVLSAEVELARDKVEDSTVRLALNTATEEAGRLSRLIDDLLLLARADAGNHKDHHPVDLDELIDVVTTRFATIAQRRGIGLSSTGAAVVQADRLSLDRAVSNLIDNALRHTPDLGTVTVQILPAGSSQASIVVNDTGPGVPASRLTSVFDRFTRIDDARHEPGGAGLGLALVAAVAAEHDGTVTATNRPHGGLSVTLSIGKSATPGDTTSPPNPVGR